MSGERPSPVELVTESAAAATERAEAAATRRRWISLAEFVAVAGLLVAVASLWLSWSDRRTDIADKQAERVAVDRAQGRVLLTGAVSKDGETITLSDSAHQLHDVQVIFPSALGVSPQSSMFGTKIESRWFESQVLAASDKHAGRLPVILAATWWDGDVKRTDRAVYDIAWQAEGRLFGFVRGRKLRMRSLSLQDRSGTQKTIDAAWARETAAAAAAK